MSSLRSSFSQGQTDDPTFDVPDDEPIGVVLVELNSVNMLRKEPDNPDLEEVREMFKVFDSKIEKVTGGVFGVTMSFDVEKFATLYDPLRVTIGRQTDYGFYKLSLKGRKMRGELEWM